MALGLLKHWWDKVWGPENPNPRPWPNLKHTPTDENIAEIVRAIHVLEDRLLSISHELNEKTGELQSQIDTARSQLSALSSPDRRYSRTGSYAPAAATASVHQREALTPQERISIEKYMNKMRIFMDEYKGLLELIDERNRPTFLNYSKYCHEIYAYVKDKLVQPRGATYELILVELGKARLQDLAINLCRVAESEIARNPKKRESDFIPAMDSLAASAGLEILLPKIGSNFQEPEHDIASHESNTGYAQGRIIRTVNRGFRLGVTKEIIQKARVVVAG